MVRMGKKELESKLIKIGSDPNIHHGSLNDPIYRASTIIFNNYESFLKAKKDKFNTPYYGRISSYNIKRLEKVISDLYQSEASVITSSGLSAISISLLSQLSKDDEILVTENCYEPVYNFCKNELVKFGIKTKFFKSNDFLNFKKNITRRTKLIYLESPGSLNYEIDQIEEIINIAKEKKIITLFDNTWATFLGFNPIKWGIDIVIESCTKYFSGHSDTFCGAIACSKENYQKIKQTAVRMGDFVSSESCVLAIRGLRTLQSRLRIHQQNAFEIFLFLKKKKCVKKILYLPDDKNKYHTQWKKYFNSSNGLITFAISKTGKIENFLDNMHFFKIGFSWGGYESLILPLKQIKPGIKNYNNSLFWFRIHIGLESNKDLIEDLEKGFNNYEAK